MKDIIIVDKEKHFEYVEYDRMTMMLDSSSISIKKLERCYDDDYILYKLHFNKELIISSTEVTLYLEAGGEESFVVGSIFNNIFRCKRENLVWRRKTNKVQEKYEATPEYVNPVPGPTDSLFLTESNSMRRQAQTMAQQPTMGGLRARG